jgi:hypothetical protein
MEYRALWAGASVTLILRFTQREPRQKRNEAQGIVGRGKEMKGIGRHGTKNLYYNIPMFSCVVRLPHSTLAVADEEFVSAKPKG